MAINPDKLKELIKKLEKLKIQKESGPLAAIVFDLLEKLESFVAEKKELEEKFDKAVAEFKSAAPDLDNVLKSVRGKDGEPGHTPTGDELAAIIKPLIPEVKDGHTPIKGKDYFTPKEIAQIKIDVTPIPGVDFELPKDGRSPMFVGKNPPKNPQIGDLWLEV